MAYKDINTSVLQKAVNDFVFYAKPSNTDRSAACTNADLMNAINKVADLFNVFINELSD